MGEINTPSGGMNLGKPVIWPSGKASGQPITPSQTTQAAGGVRQIPGRTAPASATGRAEEVAPKTPAGAATKPVSIARPLTVEDIKTHLLQIQIPDTDFNVKLASLMLKDGMELSRENFAKLFSMLEGTNKSTNMQEAAIILSMKGIDSHQALKVLEQFMAENPQLSAQLLAAQEALNSLTTALGVSKGLLDVNIITQMTALLASFDSKIKSLAEKFQFSGDNSLKLNDLLDSARAMKSLLDGIELKSQVSDSAEAQILQASLSSAKSKLSSIIDNLASQAILSQKGREEVNYQYQQIPNSEAKSLKDVEIVIKRDGQGKNASIDPENTQVVLAMQTLNLGKMVCSLIVKGKKVYIIFIFNEKDYGDEAREIIANEYASLQKKLADKNYSVTGYQVKVDPAMCKVKPYLIPMLPTLEAQLRKIDLEA
ncbi:MAG: hypothetical protein FD145_1280 [Candidatus Saganbacteria bacterium]|uniref:Flagellar hook-length control protein-like C-terminal domain-containing protein n=1 Tax=Candidatus Saganbacteria bacterium TaxID=2575572 RepID=A0A833NZM8_UNCSA|nr:MAG: hypothetical protein FD145_1280 [Candidatus Saganbacteria bacterium]